MRRVEIIAKRNIKDEIVKVAGKPKNKMGEPTLGNDSVNEILARGEDFGEIPQNNPPLKAKQQKVLKTATANAIAEAKAKMFKKVIKFIKKLQMVRKKQP